MTSLWLKYYARRPVLVVQFMRKIREKMARGYYNLHVGNEDGDLRGELEYYLQVYEVNGLEEAIRN